MDNHHQSIYSRKLCKILKKQVEPLEKLEFELKKIQFESATKRGDGNTLLFTAWLDKNAAKVKQIELVFQFKSEVSNSKATNELFSI